MISSLKPLSGYDTAEQMCQTEQKPDLQFHLQAADRIV
jgi:hypothetical protein